MSCRYTDPDTGATHEEIIDDLSCELTRAVKSLDASRKRNAELVRYLQFARKWAQDRGETALFDALQKGGSDEE